MKEKIKVADFFTAKQGEAIQRLAYSKEDIEYKRKIIDAMKKMGLEIKIDRVGNICGTLEGTGKGKKGILIGSHTDSVKDGGQYDGPVGVVAGLKCVEEIIEKKDRNELEIDADIHIVVWACEESNRFGKACLGSKWVEGTLSENELEQKEVLDRPEREKQTIQEAIEEYFREIKRLGIEYEAVERILDKEEIYRAYEEHIEQYQLLDRQNIDIGIVSSIVAPYRMSVEIQGRNKIVSAAQLILKLNEKAQKAEKQDKYRATVPVFNIDEPNEKANYYLDIALEGEFAHSGATPLEDRKDAVLEMANFIVKLNDKIKEENYDFEVYFNKVETQNQSMNKVAGKTNMRLGIDTKGLSKELVEKALIQMIEEVKTGRKVTVTYSNMTAQKDRQIVETKAKKEELKLDIRMQVPVNPKDMFVEISEELIQIAHETGISCFAKVSDKGQPVETSKCMASQVQRICQQQQVSAVTMPSWAGHDVAHINSFEKLLLFIRSTGGSHNPNETTTLERIEKGCNILTASVIKDEQTVTQMISNIQQIENQLLQNEDLNTEQLYEILKVTKVARDLGIGIKSSIKDEITKRMLENRKTLEQRKEQLHK